MTEGELIEKALNDAFEYIKEQEQTAQTQELLVKLYKAEILIRNL